MIKINAYAKINLGLDVLKKLPNGYHEVKMIMQTVDISDEVWLEKTKPGITVVTDCSELPAGEGNLVHKAAGIFLEEYGISEGVKITLHKRIPIAAGMAGGSTDAAAVLNGLNLLFDCKAEAESLCKMGVRIGADVPYCIMGGTVLAEGIGERLTRLPDVPQARLLVAKPRLDVATRNVYEQLDTLEAYPHPDIDGMREAIQRNELDGIIARLGNVLENVTADRYPIVKEMKELMDAYGARGSLMSGSGPTVFGIFGSEKEAVKAGDALREKKMSDQIFVTGFMDTSWRVLNG